MRMRRQNARNGIKEGNQVVVSLDVHWPLDFVTGLFPMTWQLIPLIILQKQRWHICIAKFSLPWGSM